MSWLTRRVHEVASRCATAPWALWDTWTFPRLWLTLSWLVAADEEGDLRGKRKAAARPRRRDDGTTAVPVRFSQLTEKLAAMPGAKVTRGYPRLKSRRN